MWLKVFYYLRMWDSTNYLAKMVGQVIIDMKVFFIIFFLSLCAFSDAFWILMQANKSEEENPLIDGFF